MQIGDLLAVWSAVIGFYLAIKVVRYDPLRRVFLVWVTRSTRPSTLAKDPGKAPLFRSAVRKTKVLTPAR